MARATLLGLALLLGLLAGPARAGLHTFYWVPEAPGSSGTLTLNVPGRDPGQPFSAADGPFTGAFHFETAGRAYAFVSETSLSVSSSGGEPDSGSASLQVNGTTGAATLGLSFATGPVADAVSTPIGTVSGNWRPGTPSADASVLASFVHVADAANSSGGFTYLTHPLLDGSPEMRFVVSKSWNPGLIAGTNDTVELFLWYDPSRGQWSIARADLGANGSGESYSVLIPRQDERIFRHTTDAGNTTGHWSRFSSPLTERNPDALVLVTPVVEILDFGAGDFWTDSPQGVFYDAPGGQWAVFNQDFSPLGAPTRFNVYVVPEQARALVHVATGSNSVGNISFLEDPALNAHANALLQHTQNWMPNFIYNAAPTGVYYEATRGEWGVFNQDGSPLSVGAAFNLLDPDARSAFWADESGGPGLNFTVLDHPHEQGRDEILLLVTQNRSAGSGVVNPEEVRVVTSTGGQHRIANLNGVAMPDGAGFNVYAPPRDLSTFVHVASSTNTIGNYTLLDHPLTRARPDALVFATPHQNPFRTNVLDLQSSVIGVWYTGSDWAIFNQDISGLPVGAAFNVHVVSPGPDAFVHTATGSTLGGRTTLDHPALNGHPEARLIVTQSWNPPGAASAYNDHAVAVEYHAGRGRWEIVTQDGASMPGASFNVRTVEPDCPDADFDGLCDAQDTCPYWVADDNLADRDGNGRGDACECGDQNGDGTVNVSDILAINAAIFDPALATPLCDANQDGLCNVGDILAVNAGIFGAELYCARHPGAVVTHDVLITDPAQAHRYRFTERIEGDLRVLDGTLASIAFPALREVTGELEVASTGPVPGGSGDWLRRVELPLLETVGGRVSLRGSGTGLPMIMDVGLPALVSVGGDVDIVADIGWVSVRGLEALTSIPGDLTLVHTGSGDTSFGVLPALDSVGGDVSIDSGFTTTSALASLRSVGGSLTWDTGNLVGASNLALLETVAGNLTLRGIETVSPETKLGSLSHVGGALVLDDVSLADSPVIGSAVVSVGALDLVDSSVPDLFTSLASLDLRPPPFATLTGNTGFTDCQAQTFVDGHSTPGVGGSIVISGNDPC